MCLEYWVLYKLFYLSEYKDRLFFIFFVEIMDVGVMKVVGIK